MNSPVTTARLLLRKMDDGDAPFILRLLNEPTFLQYIGDRNVHSLDDARAYIARSPLYLVVTRNDLIPIGMCGVMEKPWLSDPDIAYAFVPEAEGHGYAAEAATAMLERARSELGMKTLVAVVQPDNQRSIRLLEKLGFTYRTEVVDPYNGASLHQYAID